MFLPCTNTDIYEELKDESVLPTICDIASDAIKTGKSQISRKSTPSLALIMKPIIL